MNEEKYLAYQDCHCPNCGERLDDSLVNDDGARICECCGWVDDE